jgi:hypothetical protein
VIPDAAVDSGRLPRPGAQPTGHSRRPAVRTASPAGHRSARTRDTLAGSAGGGRCLTAAAGRWAWMLGRPAAAVSPPPLLRGCGGVRGGPRPSGRHPAALPAAAAVSGPADTGWGSAPGPRGRRTATVRTRRQRTRLADSGSRSAGRLRTPATAGSVVQPCGNATLDSRQQHRPLPPRCPARNGTTRCGSGQHRHA